VSSEACFQCATSGYTHCELTRVEVVPEEDTETGDLRLLDLHRDSATSDQLHLGGLREIDMEDKIKKRDSFRSSNPRIRDNIYARCYRHLQAVDITGFMLDGKKNTYFRISVAEALFAGVSNPYVNDKGR
jgi:hypothetical protein